ncbi:uncharacterized protein LOC124435532 [Xenia sp. Carnegie-2017]|uniref:uncharacterized protein LOC124435532 n=1 Tax=Xenia sp. Carnegie-2017 TaxID=2897299 RepID=UPI001F044CC1|nr:uncharacterized protein LOC124435532 [Xenia sp. Carnegie-2017]
MAVENGQKSSATSFEIHLNEIVIGKRRLRYIYKYKPNIIDTALHGNCECTPLFLGCDLLDECHGIGISSANMPRFHAKNAKQGFATKLMFRSGVRIVGIHGSSRGVWFYSIQGLFKTAFNCFSREEQNDCLLKLSHVWRKQIGDPLLKYEVQVVVGNAIAESRGILSEMTETVTESSRKSEIESFAEKGGIVLHQASETTDKFVSINRWQEVKDDIKVLKSYAYSTNAGVENSFVARTLKLIKRCLTLLSQIEKRTELTKAYDLSIRSSSSSHDNHELNSFASTKEAEDCIEESLIVEISKWLGDEFCRYKGTILKNVISFKEKNLYRIRELSPAKDLVREVFPASMLIFLCSWLQIPLCLKAPEELEFPDHRTKLFPVIQLILELANESLLSGVAHVLFSQLVQSENVQ